MPNARVECFYALMSLELECRRRRSREEGLAHDFQLLSARRLPFPVKMKEKNVPSGIILDPSGFKHRIFILTKDGIHYLLRPTIHYVVIFFSFVDDTAEQCCINLEARSSFHSLMNKRSFISSRTSKPTRPTNQLVCVQMESRTRQATSLS